MNEKTLGIVIGALNLILLVVCGVFYVGKDKVAPVISLEPAGFVYEEDLPESFLYQGVTAMDETDGDVTASVVIEKIVTDREKGMATITYGATDTSGNVGKVSRTLEMPVLTRVQFPGAGEADVQETAAEETNENAEEATEAENTDNTQQTTETVETEVTTETEVTEENQSQENAAPEGETTEGAETTESEEEGTTGGNVTVVGSSRRE